MCEIFRIHGDNIIECERITRFIINEIKPNNVTSKLLSPSTLTYSFDFTYCGKFFEWELQLLPGFNKAGRNRWEKDIFSALKENGSFLDETPDAIITYVDETENLETILCAIEFCSALQAGNQAWQRNGRAFSTGRTGCPYLYIVDFVKYELDPKTRKHKNLRFPNPVVPYSYINFSKSTGNFVAQVYVRSEEFDKNCDRLLQNFNENDFADKELAAYIVKLMCGFDTSQEERLILEKNFNVVLFLSQNSCPSTNFTKEDWQTLYTDEKDIVTFCSQAEKFNFHKIITAKGHHGKSAEFLELVDNYSIGMASKDLPFGIIPLRNRGAFANSLSKLYPSFDNLVIDKIKNGNSDLILCIIKGFKPRGDDNRPDRGILPLASMLTCEDAEIMTYIYGPIIANNFSALLNVPHRLAASNGFWKSVLALSDYIALDVPVLCNQRRDEEVLLDTSSLKRNYLNKRSCNCNLTSPLFSCVPNKYHEDDVDTGIHFIFSHLFNSCCFEGMCNPPGGDWSGLCVIYKNQEVRWLSLPRVSGEVGGKRPDHVLEFFGVFERPLLLSIESKERSCDLEQNVGVGLINYICNLMQYVPNVERNYQTCGLWRQSKTLVNKDDFEFISAAAYLASNAQEDLVVFNNSNCDLLIIMEPMQCGWGVKLVARTQNAKILKDFIIKTIRNSTCKNIVAS